MDDPYRQMWEERYAQPGYLYGTQPNRFLASQQHRLRPGMKALAVADGDGRNGVWLAEQGLDVLSVDRSPIAVGKAMALASSRGVCVQSEVADLFEWNWPCAAFDLVVSIFLHLPAAGRRRLHARMVRALRPGGLIVLQAFNKRQLDHASGGPRDVDLLYSRDDLADDFADLEILDLAEYEDTLDEGTHHRGPAALVRLLARAR